MRPGVKHCQLTWEGRYFPRAGAGAQCGTGCEEPALHRECVEFVKTGPQALWAVHAHRPRDFGKDQVLEGSSQNCEEWEACEQRNEVQGYLFRYFTPKNQDRLGCGGAFL